MPGLENRFGITTPRSAGIAVKRNRFKRLLREAYRLNSDRISVAGSLLVLLKRTDDETGIGDEMFDLAGRALKSHLKRSRQVEA